LKSHPFSDGDEEGSGKRGPTEKHNEQPGRSVWGPRHDQWKKKLTGQFVRKGVSETRGRGLVSSGYFGRLRSTDTWGGSLAAFLLDLNPVERPSIRKGEGRGEILD